MTKEKHPDNRLSRRLTKFKKKKHDANEPKKKKKLEDRSGRVWRKLNRETVKAQETEHELKEFQSG